MENYRKILITRTDRMGDVVLSTPVITSLRNACPDAYIAILVRPYTEDIVADNPDLDEVIVYDKKGTHRNWLSTIRFALQMKKKQFDLAVILHSTNRVHIITRIAGIKQRVGWNRKMGFLLTDRLPYLKREALKHEIDCNFEMLEYLGIPVVSRKPAVFIPDETRKKVSTLLRGHSIGPADTFVAVHPDASCRSKKWPVERFRDLCIRISLEKRLKCVVVGGPGSEPLGSRISGGMESSIVDLTGKLTVGQTAAVLKQAAVLVSNDSGPVHLATAVGTPVLAIFGRTHRDLGPNVWGPVGEHDTVLQRDVGCGECDPLHCPKNYACLDALSVEEVCAELQKKLGSGLNN